MKHPFAVVLAIVIAPLSVAVGQSDSPSNSVRLPAVIVTAPETPPEATTVSSIEIPDIQSSQIRETEDLSARVPNFSISSSSLHSFGDIYSIRGITNTIFFSDPAVAMYVDGVPAGDAFSFFQPLYDVSHVDIYRGPQPSLFGLNGEAGLISIQTQPATNDWHGSALASYSTYNTQDYRFTLAGPLVKDKLTLSVSGDQSLSSGFIDNTFLQRRTDSRNDLSGRAVLTWTPAPDWKITAGVESSYAMDGSQRIVSLTGNPLQVSSDIPGSLETHETRVWLDITKRFDTWQVQNIASYSRFNLNQELDLDLTPASATLAGVFPGAVPIAPGEASEINRFQQSWSEELRFESLPPPPPSVPDSKDPKDDGKDKNIITPTSASPFHWRFGFFAQGKETEGDDLRTFSVPFVFSEAFVPVPLTIYTPIAQRTLYTEHEDTIAGYANAGYTFGSLDVNAGLRVDYTRKTLERSELDGLFGTDIRFAGEYDDWTAAPTLGLTYHLTKNVELFARTSYGFKPGGFSPYTENPDLSEYKRETIWTTETGIHAEAFDGKLRGTLTGYYSGIKNYQVERTFDISDYLVVNADTAESYGAELEASWELARGLTLRGNAGLNQTHLYGYTDPITGQDLSGNRAPYVPNFTALAALDYKMDWGFRVHVEYVVMGDTDYTDTNDNVYRQNAYGLLNAQIGYEHRNFGVYLFGRNLADKRYFTLKESDINAGVIGEPRVLGVMAQVKF